LSIAASPSDYLEKIFQVPFWVEPLETDRVQRLIGSFVSSRTTPTTTPVATATTGGIVKPNRQ
jgi:hypothetical protein